MFRIRNSLGALALTITMGACDLGPRPALPQVLAVDWQAPASPTLTLGVKLSDAVDPRSAALAVILVRGEADAKVEHPPVAPSALARLVPASVAASGPWVKVTPKRALAENARYTLVLGPKLVAGGMLLGRPVALPVETGTLATAAPLLELVAPQEGAIDVPRNLRAVRVRYSRAVRAPEDVALVDEQERVLPARAQVVSGETRLELLGPLAPGTVFARAGPGAVAADGQAVFGEPPGFAIGMALRTGPVKLDGFGAITSDRCAVVRFATVEVTEAQVCANEVCAASAAARAHEAPLSLVGHLGAGALAVRATAWDETTRPEGAAQTQVLAPPDVALALTEVLFRPRGPRSQQQFVELYNAGQVPLALDGFVLRTATGENALPSATLAPGEVALVVPSGYVPGAGGDPMPPAGTRLLPVAEARLGRSGLHVGGEQLWIEDGAGAAVTRFGGWPIATVTGQSVRRVAPVACDVAKSFQATPSGTSTPGVP